MLQVYTHKLQGFNRQANLTKSLICIPSQCASDDVFGLMYVHRGSGL